MNVSLGSARLEQLSSVRKNFMKLTEIKILITSGWLFTTASGRALQPEVLYTFQVGARGPRTSLVEGSDGNFYGTTEGGAFEGAGGYSVRKRYPGTVFRVTTNGVLTVVNSFRYGGGPNGLVIGRDDHFYSTTESGGSSGYGTVSQVTTNGVLTTLVSFGATNGLAPNAGLLLGSDGNFYGTTKQGGSGYVNGSNPRYGTVFQVTTNGVLTSLTSFTGTNGSHPNELVLGRDGDLYGTTVVGGTSNLGTVFRVTTGGVLTSLASFTGSNGAHPQARLVLGNDGNLYGTTTGGGKSNVDGTGSSYGTVFKVTTNGVLTSLVSFIYDNGRDPRAGLVLGSDGAFYGTTFLAGC